MNQFRIEKNGENFVPFSEIKSSTKYEKKDEKLTLTPHQNYLSKRLTFNTKNRNEFINEMMNKTKTRIKDVMNKRNTFYEKSKFPQRTLTR